MWKKRPLLALALGLAAVHATTAVAAEADDYPSQPIRLIVPFAPGGGADTTARMIADPLGKALGQTVVVENRPGAGATIGAGYVARAKPDGYTLLYTTPGPQMTNPYLMKSLPYDPAKDLVAVSRIAVVPSVLVVAKSLEVDSVKGLIDYARAHPHEVKFASAGIGASSHLAGELFRTMADVQIDHVPYKGTGEALRDVLGGRVDMAIDSVTVYLPHIAAGSVKALGVTTPEPLPMLPGGPPIAEQLAGFDASPVNYLSAPAGTPPQVIDKLHAALVEVLQDADLRERMMKAGLLPQANTPAEMAALVESESAKWRKVIKAAGIEPQ